MSDGAYDPMARRALACGRIDASRASLVRELVAQGARRDSAAAPCAVASPRPPRSLAVLALDAMDTASGKHPVTATLHLACAAAQGALAPLARRHPWALVGGAALVGATLACAPPWRAVLRSTIAAGVTGPWVVRLLPSLLMRALAAGRPRRAAPPGSRP